MHLPQILIPKLQYFITSFSYACFHLVKGSLTFTQSLAKNEKQVVKTSLANVKVEVCSRKKWPVIVNITLSYRLNMFYLHKDRGNETGRD